MSDWADGFDLGGDWTNGYDLGGDFTMSPIDYDQGMVPMAPGLLPEGQLDMTHLIGGGSAFDNLNTGGSSPLSALARLFGGGGSGGSAGGGNLAGLLSLLGLGGAVYGGINQGNAAREGGERIQQAANDANTQANSLLGGAMGAFKPYQDAGAGALAKLQAMPQSNLAANFRPVGSGAGLSLASLGKR